MYRNLSLSLCALGFGALAACAQTEQPAKPAEKAAKPVKKAAKAPAKPKAAASLAWAPKELDLAPGETYRVELAVPSPTGKTFTGKLSYAPAKGLEVKPDPRWKDQIPGWGVKTYPWITASAETAPGDVPVEASLEKGGKATLTVRVASPGVELVPAKRQLTVRITNPFHARTMSGIIKASNPDRFLQDITTREFKVAPGMTEDVVFPLPGYAAVETERYEFTITVQTYQGYKHTQVHKLQFPEG